MGLDMKSRMNLFVAGLSCMSSKEGKATMLIGDMDIARRLVYVLHVEEEKLRDIKELRNKKAKIGSDFGQQISNMNCSTFQHNQNGARPAQSLGSVAYGGNWAPTCAKCGRNHLGACRDGSTRCFKCSQEAHFMKECPKNRQGNGYRGNRAQSSSIAPLGRAAP
ncbi:uncharacterized protein [Solanum tuberosum]|uniref:uncharacterized protein n=1 Tax=Solanum tuberosum TaxID=4113 RepID=UPI000739F95B|nr:PREDICTED: uncharacterized protein LOC107057983 [Solanum tuberosum]